MRHKRRQQSRKQSKSARSKGTSDRRRRLFGVDGDAEDSGWTQRGDVRPHVRPFVDREDKSALYDFDENLLCAMNVKNKSDRKFLGQAARCVFRLKNDFHDYQEARIAENMPARNMWIFSIIYKGSVTLDHREQMKVKEACGPRFVNCKCVTIPFDTDAMRRHFEMSCMTQIVLEMMKKRASTEPIDC